MDISLHIVGYFSALMIGLSLGLLGGGGSVLTMPVLVYLFHIDPVLATAYSLFVVGFSAAIGSINYIQRGLVSYSAVWRFGLPSILAVYLTRQYLLPAIPTIIWEMDWFILTKNAALMLLFAFLMVMAAISMIRECVEEKHELITTPLFLPFTSLAIVLEGFIVGILTGLVGAGGGFMIIPALVILTKLPMKLAVGTSLLIITAKSLLGFLGDINNQALDWQFLVFFTGLAVCGILLGTSLSQWISALTLKKSFGYFVIIIGLGVLCKELLA